MDDKAIERVLTEWAAALEVDAGELRAAYEEFLAEEKGLHPQLTSEQVKERALRRTRIRAKREHGPQAFVSGTADAVILGTSGLIDSLQRLRDEAVQLYRENPKQAVKLGIVDAKGQPVDTRKVFPSGKPNPFFGRPMRQRNTIQIIAGIASFETDGQKTQPQLFTATLDRNAPGSAAPPLFHRVRFAVSGLTEEAYRYGPGEPVPVLRVSVPRGVAFEDLGAVDVPAVVRKYAPHIFVPLEDLDAWAGKASELGALDDRGRDRRLVAVEGDVVRMDLVPNEQTRNRRLQIDNGKDIKAYGTTVWVPETVPIDFAEESRVLAIGNVRPGNPESGFGASVNAMGVHAYDDFKVPLPEGLQPVMRPEPLPPVEPGLSEADVEGIAQRADEVFGTGVDGPPPAMPVADANASYVLVAIKKAQGRDGATTEQLDVAAKRAKLDWLAVEKALEALLDAGRVYESRAGYFKTLEEPTREEFGIYGRMGGA